MAGDSFFKIKAEGRRGAATTTDWQQRYWKN